MNEYEKPITKKQRMDYYQSLADTLPMCLKDRELLYEKYQEYIKMIRTGRWKDGFK